MEYKFILENNEEYGNDSNILLLIPELLDENKLKVKSFLNENFNFIKI